VHQEKFTESSQQFNDLFANLIACSETISIPPQDAINNPTEPAQIAVQEEFAESISSQEVQPEFLLQ